MTERVLLPSTSHPPWTRDVAEFLVKMEDPERTHVVVARVFDDEEAAALTEIHSVDSPSMEELAASHNSVEAARSALTEAGFAVETIGLSDSDTYEPILRAVNDHDIDRIYLYNRNRSPVGKAIYGSSVQEVLAKATRPVVVVPGGFIRTDGGTCHSRGIGEVDVLGDELDSPLLGFPEVL